MGNFDIDFKSSNDCIKVRTEEIENGVELFFSGAIDDKNPEEYLSPFFSEINNRMINLNSARLDLNLKDLTFLNSSGIKCFVQLVTYMMKIPQEKRYRLTMKIDTYSQWQNTSFSLLKTVSKDYIVIEKI
ncbi:MAG TPA: hypothetical protein PLO89_11600 [Spirochaetota bacterium]|nr:hypothetical protein [Spirochaetota bacterium]